MCFKLPPPEDCSWLDVQLVSCCLKMHAFNHRYQKSNCEWSREVHTENNCNYPQLAYSYSNIFPLWLNLPFVVLVVLHSFFLFTLTRVPFLRKAHPQVLNVLLQLLDDGRITDSHGRTDAQGSIRRGPFAGVHQGSKVV